MAFEIVSFANINQDHYYYFVDRFNLSTNRDLYDALFYTPDDEYEPKVQLESQDGLELFRFKVNIKDFGSFVFFFDNAEFKDQKSELFNQVKELKTFDDPVVKTKLLLKHVSKVHLLFASFLDERKEVFDFLAFRKFFMNAHVKCRVLVFRAEDLHLEPKKAPSSYKETFKKVVLYTKKSAHAVKVASVATAKAVKKATFAAGRFFKKVGHAFATCGKAIARAAKFSWNRIIKPCAHGIATGAKATWRGIKFVCVPTGKFLYSVGIWILIGLEFIGYYLGKFFKLLGRGISKVSPKFLPFMKKVFSKIGKGIKTAAIFVWKGIKKLGILIGKGFKKLGILLGRFFNWLGALLWRFMKWLGRNLWKLIKWCAKWLWIFIKWCGRWLWVFMKWLGRQLKKFFVWLGRGIKKFPSYLEWQNDYLFYFIFSMLFSFALLAAIVWAMNGDPLSVFFFVMTALFVLVCIYATYVHRADHKVWNITVQNVLTPNIAIFLGLTAGVIASFFTSKSIIKLAEGQTLDFILAMWITIGASGFMLIVLNFTPFIIHFFKTRKQNKPVSVTESPAKVEENPEIAGENTVNNENEKHDEEGM